MDRGSEGSSRFGDGLKDALFRSTRAAREALGDGERIRVDLHCHDRNSDRPDERLGRILGVPETWVETRELLRVLRENGTDLVTVTNHNDARSCWMLQDAGIDVLTGAEFSCTVPEFRVGIHVLAYGFTPAQFDRMLALRGDAGRFAEYCADQDLPTVLAHPLHFHSPDGLPPLELMDRLGLMFERFEVVNGQRDAWQNALCCAWVEGMDEEEIDAMSRRTGIRPDRWTRRAWTKMPTGGSDDHMALFAGATGTVLGVPGSMVGRKMSEMALEALRRGSTAPYGGASEEEKLSTALLDFLCQVVLRMEDPGLARILLHRGDPEDKVLALAIANGVALDRRSPAVLRFVRMLHGSLRGQRPGIVPRLFARGELRPLVDLLDRVAISRRGGSDALAAEVSTAFPELFHRMSLLLAERVRTKISDSVRTRSVGSGNGILERLAIPSQPWGPHLLPPRNPAPRGSGAGELVDGLVQPLLVAAVVGASRFAAARVLHGKRPFVDGFAARLGTHRHPRRALWLTDTFGDRNGVSTVLEQLLDEVRRRDLPVDFLVSSDRLESGPHLRVVRPVAEFRPAGQPQPIRVPDLLQVHDLFRDGGYDRVVCSTEGPMGAMGLHLKTAFGVSGWFFAHTDWMGFARRTLGFGPPALDRTRRLLRAFYRSWDGIFVLNSQMRSWLASDAMDVPLDRLHSTAHWPHPSFGPGEDVRTEIVPDIGPGEMVLLFAGRVSDEKGVGDLPALLSAVRARGVAARLVVAGEGPARERLAAEVPDAVFLGWCDRPRLSRVFASADLLLMPSRFDTFGCAVVEAMACGLPVAAFPVQGPRDIVEHGRSGLLAETAPELGARVAEALGSPESLAALRRGALARAASYDPVAITDGILGAVGLGSGVRSTASDDSSHADSTSGVFAELLSWMRADPVASGLSDGIWEAA